MYEKLFPLQAFSQIDALYNRIGGYNRIQYSQTSIIRTSNIRAPPSTGQVNWLK